MFSKLFKKDKKEATKGNLEKLNSNELKNVIGGASANYNSSKSNTAGIDATDSTTGAPLKGVDIKIG